MFVDSFQAFALDRNEIDEAIEVALSARHPTDNKKFWRNLGPQAVDVILDKISLAQNGIKKDKLILALGFFGDDPRAVNFLKKSIETEERTVQKKFLYSGYSRALGEYNPDLLNSELKDCLSEKDPNTRLVCAEAFKVYGKQDAATLQDWMRSEKSQWVIDKFKNIKAKATFKLSPVSSTETVFWKIREGSYSLKTFEWNSETHQIVLTKHDLKVKVEHSEPTFSFNKWTWSQQDQSVRMGQNDVKFSSNKDFKWTEYTCDKEWGFLN